MFGDSTLSVVTDISSALNESGSGALATSSTRPMVHPRVLGGGAGVGCSGRARERLGAGPLAEAEIAEQTFSMGFQSVAANLLGPRGPLLWPTAARANTRVTARVSWAASSIDLPGKSHSGGTYRARR